tara:strand:+ start:145 stop:537 length:393 start_codon:yes stop_codon:yes gene_type:complete
MTLIRDLEKKAKLLRLEGSNSMALLLQNAADRIESLTLEAQTKDCELNSQKGVIQSVRDIFNIRVHDFNLITAIKLKLEKRDLEQQAKGAFIVINNVLGEPKSLTCEAAQWRRELIDRANQLRQQAKELK